MKLMYTTGSHIKKAFSHQRCFHGAVSSCHVQGFVGPGNPRRIGHSVQYGQSKKKGKPNLKEGRPGCQIAIPLLVYRNLTSIGSIGSIGSWEGP